MKKKLILTAIVCFSILFISACVTVEQKLEGSKCTNDVRTTGSKKYTVNCLLPLEYIANKKAIIETSQGTIEFDLLSGTAPNTVSNFIFLSEQGFYDGLTFHRRDDEIKVIQGGDPKGDGTGGPGYTFAEEPPSTPDAYKKGVVAMAKSSAENTTGSQFFIMLDDFAGFDPVYSIFGQIIKGQDVVNLIQPGDKIISVKIESK